MVYSSKMFISASSHLYGKIIFEPTNFRIYFALLHLAERTAELWYSSAVAARAVLCYVHFFQFHY